MTKPLFSVDKLTYVQGKRTLLQSLSFAIQPGEIVGLIGPNGAGKTTTFYLLTGLYRPTSGSILLERTPLTHLPPHKRAQAGLGYLPQESALIPTLTVRQNITIYLDFIENHTKEEILLKQFNLTKIANTYAGHLSGGEKRRLDTCIAMLTQPKVLLLDEPFANVDPITIQQLQSDIQSWKATGLGVLITDHNAKELLRFCDRCLLLIQGELLMEGTPEELTSNTLAQSRYFGWTSAS